VTGCAEYGPEVSAYLDDGLAPDERRRVELHLGGCASCAALLGAGRELDQALRELLRIEPSRGFEAKLRARLSLGAAAAPRWRRRSFLTRSAGVAAAAAAALALLLSPPQGTSFPDEDWELIADEDSFDLMLSDDHELVYALDALEAWDEKEEI
jgi:anti-sigma factor RsiW